MLLFYSLFSILGNGFKQVILSVEAVPTDQGGLGVKLTNSSEEGIGCVVKTVAETSTAKGILHAGDRYTAMLV